MCNYAETSLTNSFYIFMRKARVKREKLFMKTFSYYRSAICFL